MKPTRSTSTASPKAQKVPALLQQSPPGAAAEQLARTQGLLFVELAPSNPLEESIARDIIAVDSDLALLPKRRNLILWQYAITPMYEQLRHNGACDDDKAKELAFSWAQGSQEAEQAIIALGIDPAVAHNLAYIENILLIREIERQIDLCERRRRQLLADYNRLKPDRVSGGHRRPSEIDDAEIILDAGPEPVDAA